MVQQSSIFTDLISKGTTKGQIPAKNRKAIEWYRQQAMKVNSVARRRLLRDHAHEHKAHTTNKGFEVGSFYIYNYDPKLKAELEVYDTFPVVVPFRILKDRFYALNFHYLNFRDRAKLMDILYTIANNKAWDDSTRLKITWQVIKAIAKRKLYEVTVHCYLKRKVKSKLLYVHPSEWDIAIFLPIAKFNGPKAAEYAGH